MTLHRATWGVASLLILAGCGGGDDGGGGGGSIPPPATMAVITAANAPVIAGAVVSGALEGGLIGSVAGLGPVSSPATLPATLDGSIRAARAVLNVPIPEETTDCLVDGTVTISGDLANPLTLSPNDTINLVFADCDEGDGVVLNGTYAMVIVSFDGDLATGMFTLTVRTTLSDFRVDEGGDVTTAGGTITIAMDTMASPVGSITVSGDFTVTSGGVTQTLTNFSFDETLDESVFPEAYTVDTSGTLETSNINGGVTFTTTITFQGSADGFPSAGELLITGANNTTVKLIALDSMNVRLEVDIDGDGATDVTIDTTWETLDG